jgi:hypothetical protein
MTGKDAATEFGLQRACSMNRRDVFGILRCTGYGDQCSTVKYFRAGKWLEFSFIALPYHTIFMDYCVFRSVAFSRAAVRLSARLCAGNFVKILVDEFENRLVGARLERRF